MSGNKEERAGRPNRGFMISSDSVWALAFTVMFMLGFIGMQVFDETARGKSSFQALHGVSENGIDTMNKRGVLEEIGYHWASGNLSLAANITKENLDILIPNTMGYRLEIVDQDNVTVIYSSDNGTASDGIRPREAESAEVTRSQRMISGYSENSSRSGWTSRAWLIENQSWETKEASNVSDYGKVYDEIYFGLPGPGSRVFYVMVPGGALLTSGFLNISWEGVQNTMTSSSSSSSTVSTASSSGSSSSSETSLGGCHVCPNSACPIYGWYNTRMDYYDYHSFDVPAGETCNLDIKIYTGEDGPLGTNIYDIYFNKMDNPACGATCNPILQSCNCQCQRPPQLPQTWSWDCTTFFDGPNKFRTCSVFGLTAGTYQAMVDCWSPEGGDNLCPGQYYIYVRSLPGSTAGCPNYPEPDLSSSSSGSSASMSSSSGSTSSSISSTYAPGMLAYWRFEDNGADSVGGNHVTEQGPVSYVSGKVGKAADLDGASSYFKTAAVRPSVNLFQKNVTILGWVKFHKLDGAYRSIYSYDRGGGNWYTFYVSDANTLHMRLSGDPTHQWLNGGVVFTEDTWYLLASTYNTDDGRISHYVNGQPDNSGLRSWGNPATATDKVVWIGASPVGEYLNASVDELRIYDKALTQTEIRNIYLNEVGKDDGEDCNNIECKSGNCAPDYDGAGKWCAPAGNCAHNATSPGSCGSGCYSYISGSLAEDCNSATSLWSCNPGSWGRHECPICGSGMGINAPCLGRKNCVAGSPAYCTDCNTTGLRCDYCVSDLRGAPGSDSIYNASCDGGACKCNGNFLGDCSNALINCAACTSCNITARVGSCEAQGVNYYMDQVNDTLSPNKCAPGQWCDGLGSCVAAPITGCSAAPTGIIFQSGVCDPPGFADNCRKDSAGADGVRLTERNHFVNEAYQPGWEQYGDIWTYKKQEQDQISIGDPSWAYVKHKDSFEFNATVGSGSKITFKMLVMPHSDCSTTVDLYTEPSNDHVGSCTVGVGSCTPMSMAKSKWHDCVIVGDNAIAQNYIVKNQVNTFKVTTTPNVVGSFCGVDTACVTYFDSIGITCGI